MREIQKSSCPSTHSSLIEIVLRNRRRPLVPLDLSRKRGSPCQKPVKKQPIACHPSKPAIQRANQTQNPPHPTSSQPFHPTTTFPPPRPLPHLDSSPLLQSPLFPTLPLPTHCPHGPPLIAIATIRHNATFAAITPRRLRYRFMT